MSLDNKSVGRYCPSINGVCISECSWLRSDGSVEVCRFVKDKSGRFSFKHHVVAPVRVYNNKHLKGGSL